MVENWDLCVCFFYKKNLWNFKIVQGYYDVGLEILEFIEKNVVLEVGVDGKKKFVKWGGLGELWVCYYGMIEVWMVSNDNIGKYKWFFFLFYINVDKELYLYNSEGNNLISYIVYFILNQMMIIGCYYNVVDQVLGVILLDDIYIFIIIDCFWYGMYMSVVEVNFYLVEFVMLNNQEVQVKMYYDKVFVFFV